MYVRAYVKAYVTAYVRAYVRVYVTVYVTGGSCISMSLEIILHMSETYHEAQTSTVLPFNQKVKIPEPHHEAEY